MCHPQPGRPPGTGGQPQALLSPPLQLPLFPTSICWEVSALWPAPEGGESAMSPEIPPCVPAQHSLRLMSWNFATQHVFHRWEKCVSLSSCDAPPGWQGIPGVWPWALEPAHLGSDLPSALCWLLTFSKCRALLSIGILICKMGTLIVPASQGHCKDA